MNSVLSADTIRINTTNMKFMELGFGTQSHKKNDAVTKHLLRFTLYFRRIRWGSCDLLTFKVLNFLMSEWRVESQGESGSDEKPFESRSPGTWYDNRVWANSSQIDWKKWGSKRRVDGKRRVRANSPQSTKHKEKTTPDAACAFSSPLSKTPCPMREDPPRWNGEG